MTYVAFELQDDIHYMLQHFRSGDRAVLGDVPDEYDRDVAFLCETQQAGRAFPYLCDRTGCRLHAVSIYRLNGVHDEQVRCELLRVFDNIVHESLAQYGTVVLHVPVLLAEQSHGSQLYLTRGLLSGDIEGAQSFAPERYLQCQGGFADTRLASQQNHGAGDNAASQHPFHFPVADQYPAVL